MNLNEHYKHTLDWTQKYWSFKTLHYIIPVFHQNGVGLVTTTERLIFVNPNKSKSMTESLFQYLQSCPCGGYECDWWCAGARPQLPVLPSEVATSSPLPPSHTARQPVIMSTWLAALHPLSSGSHLAPVITLTLLLHGYIISKQLHWHWLHHHQSMNGYFEESLYIVTQGITGRSSKNSLFDNMYKELFNPFMLWNMV